MSATTYCYNNGRTAISFATRAAGAADWTVVQYEPTAAGLKFLAQTTHTDAEFRSTVCHRLGRLETDNATRAWESMRKV